jgi:HSP20 family molecular chaperone IbpA
MKKAPKSAFKVTILDNSEPIFHETGAVESRIRQRAFELSQTRSHDAHQQYDWMVAESEVVSIPPAELIERDGKFEVKFAVAGVQPEDVILMVTPDQILLKSEWRHAHESGTGVVHFCDFKSATVFRSVNLPEPIDVKSVKTSLSGGMIVVSALKKGMEPATPKRTAPIRKSPAKKTRATSA